MRALDCCFLFILYDGVGEQQLFLLQRKGPSTPLVGSPYLPCIPSPLEKDDFSS